jgi:hypothetical protein
MISDRTRIILSIDLQNIVLFGNIIYSIFVLHFEVRNVGFKMNSAVCAHQPLGC